MPERTDAVADRSSDRKRNSMSIETERDVARARIAKAIAALENGDTNGALCELRGEGLCTPYQCASLRACHRLLERWQRRFARLHRNLYPDDRILDSDTDAMLVGGTMPSACPACQQALAIACPSCGRKYLEAP
jgi:hypothetical protein